MLALVAEIPEVKRCSACGVVKAADQFYGPSPSSPYLSSACKPCEKEATRTRRDANREAVNRWGRESMRQRRAAGLVPPKTEEQKERYRAPRRAWELRTLYGITVEQYEAMLEAQGGLCAICRCPEIKVTRDGRPRALCVDHDHVTGEVRGLLCVACNTVCGHADDDPKRLRAAADYLERSREET